ncbi:MAG: hypothetical protein ACJAT1_001111 [Marivirga sp.]|jgi:hypothetical protein
MRLLSLLLLVFCFSCSSELREKPISTYYNVDSLLNNQLRLLVQEQVAIKKQISIDGQHELDTVSFDSLGWNNELAVFRIADINKPNLKGLYKATEERLDDQIIWRYITEKPSLGIEYLYVYFLEGNKIDKIEARYNEDNALYTSERNLTLNFDPDTKLLNAYKVEGSQKMILKDPVVFKIASQVL